MQHASWTYAPNSLNDLVSRTNAKGQVTAFAYDLLGRMTSRLEPESATPTTWTYGASAAAHNIGRLQTLSRPDGYAESYSFDAIGRSSAATFTMDGSAYQVSYAGNSTQFFYNANHQRWKQVANYGAVSETTWYIGGMLEKVLRSGVTEFRHLIPAGSSTALYTRRDNGTNGTYYLTSDHLGSGDLVLDSAARVRPQ